MTFDPVKATELPAMKFVEQQWEVPPPIDIQAEIDAAWAGIRDKVEIADGARIAIGVGSRGVANIAAVAAGVAAKLKEAGAEPFVTPAMGSHGGAVAEGQIEVLAHRGVTPETVGCPVEATMDVVSLGEADGIPIFIDRLAYEADGIVVINRVKTHTNFYGPTESGLIKMMAIGLGNQEAAECYHRLTMIRDYGDVLRTAGRAILEKTKVIFGVMLVENQEHQTMALKMAAKPDIYTTEVESLKLAKSVFPTIPVDDIDLLIIDEMGKDISGEGIDPNVVGRDVCSCGMLRTEPTIHRIFIRDLTEATEGSAIGVGQADFTVTRLVDKIDFPATSINCLTGGCPEAGKVPLTYDNDALAIAAAIKTVRPYTLRDFRVVHIKNTMELKYLLVSEAYWAELETRDDMAVAAEPQSFQFDGDNELVSPLLDPKLTW